MRKRLKEVRESNNMTQKQISDKLGISMRQYQRIENGDSDGTFKTWDLLEDMFHVPQRMLREIAR